MHKVRYYSTCCQSIWPLTRRITRSTLWGCDHPFDNALQLPFEEIRMSSLKTLLARSGNRLDTTLDEIRNRLRRRLRIGYGPVYILPYRSYGTAEEFVVMGRVIEQRTQILTEDDDSWWDNLLNMYRRFASREIAGVPLRVRYGDDEVETLTDGEGYFRATLKLSPSLPFPGWFNAHVAIKTPAAYGKDEVSAESEVLIPPSDATFGIISDIDDTVVLTHATNFLKMARMVFLGNARSRLPFPGVAAFYHALCQGKKWESSGAVKGTVHNPIFYVSSSAWNIYDLLIDFLAHNDIPAGPLMLADYGFDPTSFPFVSHDTHKMAQIRQVLETYPNLPFILIGDSGQRDHAIYQQVNFDYPGRILAIYLRDVQWLTLDSSKENAKIETLPNGVEVVVAPNTAAAASHAAEHGFISPEALPSIGVAAVADASAPGEVETILDELAVDEGGATSQDAPTPPTSGTSI
jgi:phosphatidate phosphatase APP1